MRAKILLLATVLYAVPAAAGAPPYVRPTSSSYNQLGTSLYYQQFKRSGDHTTMPTGQLQSSRLPADKALAQKQLATARAVQKANGPSTVPASYLTQPISKDAFRKLKMGEQGALYRAVDVSYQAWKFANDRRLGATTKDMATLRAYSYLLSAPQRMYFDMHAR